MNDKAEAQSLNYDTGCDVRDDGTRPPNCAHNDRAGKESYKRMKDAGLIDASMTSDQYAGNTRQFQAMYQALGSLKHDPNTPQNELDLLAGLPIETSAEEAHGMTQHGFNVSSIDGKNGVLTSSSHVGIEDEPGITEVVEERGCPDEAAKQAECAARNAGGGATAPLFNPPVITPPDNRVTNDDGIPLDAEGNPFGGGGQGELEGDDPELTQKAYGSELPRYQGDEGSSAVTNTEGTSTEGGGAGTPAGTTWVWNSKNCQCEQGPGEIKQGTPPEMIPWVQDQNNLAGAMWAKSREGDQGPLKQKLQYEDADYTSNDPLTRIHAANALAESLGENATHAQKMDLFTKAAGSNREAVQNVQEADVRGYNQFEQTNAINRAKIDALNSGFASEYVDDTNRVQAERIAKDQAHDANINMQNNALLTNMANTYNQNSLYPNYNVRPDQAGAIQFTNPQALRDEQSQGSAYPRIDEFAAWEAAYPNHTTDQIIDLMGKARENAGSNGGRQGPSGYPPAPTAKHGREMRDLQANRKALRRWILGI